MSSSFSRRCVSVSIVLCMLAGSIAILFSATTVRGTTYQPPMTYVDGNETGQFLGRSVALMDLNGDHIGDLIAGAPYTSAYGLFNAGSVRVYVSAGGVPMANVIVINGTNSEDLFGYVVANVSDVNGDGWSDLAVGSPMADPSGLVDAGNVTIYYGWSGFDGSKPNVTINSVEIGEEFGSSIAPAGDVTGDGFDDMIVGAAYYGYGTMAGAGRVYVYYGGNPMNSVPDKTFTGDVIGAHLGFSVAGGVNVDQDATLDMVAGAPDRGAAGSTYIIRNLDRVNPTINVVNGKAAGDKFGYSVAMVPDIDGNTFGEIAVGAPYNDDNGSNAGEVSLIYGSSKFNTGVDLTLMGSPGESFGRAIAAGDFHQDGYSDVLVGAPESRLNATSIGRAYAYFGARTPSTSPNITLVPDTGADFFGGSLAIGDNITGDKAVDFAVGDPSFSLPGPPVIPNAGRVYLYAGEGPVTPPLNPLVQGYVYVPGTALGLPGFTVSLESPTFNKSTTTNAAGYYQITAVPGTYWLNASRTGYVTNFTYPVTLVMDEVRSENFYPFKVPVVTGTVTDAVLSNTIQGATVALYNGTSLVTVVTTPANGTYWILLPTEYVPGEGAATDLTLKVWDSTHYTNVTDFNVVRNETKFVNATLDRFPVVAGTVQDALDLSAVRGSVEANQGTTIVATTTTDIRGRYSFAAVNASSTAMLWVNVTATGYFKTNKSLMVDKNNVYTLNFILVRENVKPISQVSPLPEYEATESFAVTATASDPNDNGIKEVQLWYRMSGAGSYTNYATDSSSPYIFDFDTATAGGDGIYEFYSIAVDYADNTEDAPVSNDTWTYVDSHAPTLTITVPTQDQLIANATVQVNWTGSDTGSGIASYQVRLDSGAWVDRGQTLYYAFPGVADGNHSVRVNATDRAGHSTEVSAAFSVDSTPPTVSITMPVNDTAISSTAITMHWLAYDNGSGIATVKVSRDGTSWDSVNISSTEFTFSGASGLIEGPWTIYVRVTDRGGLSGTAWVNLVLDRTEPTVTISTPSSGQKIGKSNLTVRWAMMDSGTGIAQVQISVDGGAFTAIGTVQSYNVRNLEDGEHNITLRVTDNAGNHRDVSVTFTVSTGGGISSVMVGGIAVIVIVVAIVAVLLMKRKKGPVTEPVKKGPEK